jgi:hypothetical protein
LQLPQIRLAAVKATAIDALKYVGKKVVDTALDYLFAQSLPVSASLSRWRKLAALVVGGPAGDCRPSSLT